MTPRLLTKFGDVFYAFDKPAGMAVHQNAEDIPDLVTWIEGQKSLPRALKPGHRLDRATSGIVMCGAGRKARAQIASWLEEIAIKHYIALVAGDPTEDAGVIELPLLDARRERELECQTDYVVLERFNGFTLLELDLVTGRKHQLRRHMADMGLHIVGDKRYGPKRPKRIKGFPNRLWLHAFKITLGEKVIEAPLPAVLQEHLDLIRAG